MLARLLNTQTEFYKTLVEKAHKFFRVKIRIMPKCALCGFNWFNAYYTPGVSRISTNIRVTDGDVTPVGGLGVMKGKKLLMKYLCGIDAVPICIDSKVVEKTDADTYRSQADKVVDVLREICDIPVYYDDQQGTAPVTLAGLLNALRLVYKRLEDIEMVFIGAGSANATCLRLIVSAGADPKKIVMFNINGSLRCGRDNIEKYSRFYRKWVNGNMQEHKPKQNQDILILSWSEIKT
ncbi:malic enzyme, putative [Entamoeba invadens IP1]|uniref:Malic enzyme, putative n=1 Tax=Entamoeba invadens IP1 TaxID=370355 RepID=A0A0A1U7P3_ENTIV|nr:malic enzyme, putative [Entamoeba invadens IP1]ELP90903.1 malic enzyme, putative [Entamoeba invadens IP1]|eukprot:XP_004257674.1 malic enzyme, putative [Entamoeba invadens IP1]